jgi:gliding motility-associated-like protein
MRRIFFFLFVLAGIASQAQTVNYQVRVVALRAQGDNNDGGGFAGEQDPTFYIWARENVLTNWNANLCTHLADDTWDTWNGVNIPLITGTASSATQIIVEMECWEDDCPTGDECTFDNSGFSCIGNTDDNKAGRGGVIEGPINFRNDPACQWNSYIVSIDGSGSLPDYGLYFAEIEIMWEYSNFTAGVNNDDCGTAINLTGNGTGTWSVVSGPGIGTFANTNDPMTTFSGNVAGTYTLQYTALAGCPTQTNDQVDVTLLGFPDPNLTANDPGCVGQTLSYTAQNGVTYAFQIGENGPTLQLGANATFNSNFVAPGDTVFVFITDANGCQGSDFYVPNIATSPSVSLGADQTVCPGTPYTLDATTPFVSYLWSTGATTSTIQVTQAGTYSVTVTNSNNCTDTDDIVITLFPQSTVDLGNDTTICQGNPFVMDAGAGFTAYSWSSGGTNQTETVSTFGTYTVTVTDGNGCQVSDDITLTPLINNFTLMSDTTIYLGQPITLTATGGSGYQWSTGATTASITVSPTEQTTYTVNVLYPDGCYDIGTVIVSVSDELNVFIPNMFSPNGDGVNDALQVYGYGIQEVTFRVYNRWGHLVYEETDLSDLQNVGWDGTADGVDQPNGTYVWTIQGTTLTDLPLQYRDPVSNEVSSTGTVLLRR